MAGGTKTRTLPQKEGFQNIESVPLQKEFEEKLDTKSAPFSFWQIDDEALHSADEKWQVTNIHTQRDAVRGRATTDAGAVYRYISLPE